MTPAVEAQVANLIGSLYLSQAKLASENESLKTVIAELQKQLNEVNSQGKLSAIQGGKS